MKVAIVGNGDVGTILPKIGNETVLISINDFEKIENELPFKDFAEREMNKSLILINKFSISPDKSGREKRRLRRKIKGNNDLELG